MHHRATEFFFGGYFASRRFQQGRASKESPRSVAHHDDVVGEPRLVCPACSGRTMGHCHHGQPSRRHTGDVAKQVATANKLFYPIGKQVGASTLNKLNIGQLVL